MDNYIGKMLDGRYEILEAIGNGGMAVVYKAKCHRLNRLVAIKILKDENSQDSEFRRRFQAESQAVAMLSHPNIVSVYDVSQSGDTDYIVMELIDGITLKQYMEKKGVLNWRETLHFTMQIAKALEHAHSRGIVHRDIKPHNIMILKNGSVKVADFGIARVSSAQNTLTREALGSVHYISPEQARGSRVDNRTDIYSLGVVMYEMLTGRAPYDGESPVAVAIKHINAGAPMPSTLNPNIPGGLEQITMHAMCANLDERYSSATEMLYDLEEFRKNPNILFNFRGTPAPVRPKVQLHEKTPADRRAEERARRKKLEEERKKAKQKRIRNIALIAGGILAILLLIILLASSCGKKADMVTVPSFENMVYADLNEDDYPDFILVEDSKEYSDEFEAGHIIRQSPTADKQVEAGTKILLVISLGERNDSMPDVVEMKSSEAEQLLKSMDMDLTIRIETMYDEKIEKNRVIRTDPEENVTLTEGQTVTLFVSLGSETPTVEVPKVEGEKLTKAITMLTKAGLEYKKTFVDSDEEKNTVVGQSIKPGKKVDKGTVVELEISNGPAEEEEPEEEPEEETEEEPEKEPDKPTEPEPPAEPIPPTEPDPGPAEVVTTKVYTVSVEDHSEPVTVDVICAPTGERCAETVQLEPGENAINIALTGSGNVSYNVYVDGSFYSTFTMNFG